MSKIVTTDEAVARMAAARPEQLLRPERIVPSQDREQHLQRILAETPEWERQRRVPGSTVRRRTVQRRAWLGAASVGMAAAITAALFVAPPSSDRSGGGFVPPLGPAPATAAEVLLQAATATPSEPDVLLGPGQFQYVRTERLLNGPAVSADGPEDFSLVTPATKEMWTAADGSYRVREVLDQPRLLSQRDQELWERQGRPDLLIGRTSFGVQRLEPDGRIAEEGAYAADPGGVEARWALGDRSGDELLRLAEDPVRLEAHLREVAVEELRQPERDWQPDDEWTVGDQMVMNALVVLRSDHAPAVLRAALYQVLADLDGLELIEGVPDQAGRPVVAVGFDEAIGLRQEILFDRETFLFLGERGVVVDPGTGPLWEGIPAGTVVVADLVLESRIVDEAPDLPRITDDGTGSAQVETGRQPLPPQG